MIQHDAPAIDTMKTIVSKHLNSNAIEVERVFSGVSTYVYLVRSGREIYYARVLPEAGRSFGAEVHVHRLLRNSGVSVPEAVFFEHRNELVGLSVMLVKEIPGSSIEHCSSLDECEAVLYEAGKQLAIINEVEVARYGWIRRDGDKEAEPVLRGEKLTLQEHLNECFEADLLLLSKEWLHKDEVARIRSIVNAGSVLMVRHPSCLVHGDFDDSHIFAGQGTFTGIIDFGEMQGGSPLYDLGHYKLHDGQRYAGYPALARGYADARGLTAQDRTEIDLWALWIGVRRLGMIQNRSWSRYHEHLIRMVKLQAEVLNDML